jgi:predicted ribosome quality control (RQC) complex YloA/Tae2 family protein
MSLGAREIEALVRELQPLVGARVDAVRQHAERALTLELHGRAGGTLLLLSAEPDVTRLHVASRRPPQPDHPFAAQALLRKALEGSRLAALTVLPGDRVVALDLARSDGDVRLVAELTGRHGNLFLLGADGIIRACAGRNLSVRRSLVVGQRYEPPAPPPPAATEAAARQERDAPPRTLAPEGVAFPLSAEVERRYAEREEVRRLADGRRRLREPLRAALARARRALERLAEEAARVPAAESDRRTADLLKQNLRLLKRGQREVTLTEWTDEGAREVTVALDPALSPQQNMERHYRRYRRIVESAARVEARAADVRAREAALRTLLDAVDAAPIDALPRLEREARTLSAGPRPEAPSARRRRDEPLPPYRSFRSLAGAAILVGRGAAENDALTLRHARGNDAWLHARGIAGAHVVVRVAKGQAPDQETLLDAAHLAVHFSDARGAPTCDVAWTRARFVRKPKGSAPGAVTYSQERVIPLRVEPARIERLLSEEESPP